MSPRVHCVDFSSFLLQKSVEAGSEFWIAFAFRGVFFYTFSFVIFLYILGFGLFFLGYISLLIFLVILPLPLLSFQRSGLLSILLLPLILSDASSVSFYFFVLRLSPRIIIRQLKEGFGCLYLSMCFNGTALGGHILSSSSSSFSSSSYSHISSAC